MTATLEWYCNVCEAIIPQGQPCGHRTGKRYPGGSDGYLTIVDNAELVKDITAATHGQQSNESAIIGANPILCSK